MIKNLCLFTLFISLSLFLCSCTCEQHEEVKAPVESIDIRILESFPVQILVEINGYLPTPCYEITRIEKQREGNTFYIQVMMKDNGFVCIQVIEPYHEVVTLDVYGLPKGDYHIDVNGVTASFTLVSDNILIDSEE